MRGRKLRSGSLVALLGALILVLGAAPTFGQESGYTRGDVYDVFPDKRKLEYPRRAGRVKIRFRKPLVTDDDSKPVSITVKDACGRVLSNDITEVGSNKKPPAEGDNGWFDKAIVQLDRRKTNPKGLYDVTVEYWLEEENSKDPEIEDPPSKPRTYTYKFRVRWGPDCEEKPGGGGNNPPAPDPDENGDKNRVWGNTSGNSGHENLRSPVNSSSPTHSGHTDTSDFDPYTSYTSPTIPSSGDDHTNNRGSSTTPFGEDDFGDPFGESTGNSPLSDPTDPSLYDSEAGQIPEEAADQQTLSAAPVDDLGPESGTLVVALATALLLGVGGGLFLRRTDPAPIRPRS